MFIALESTEEEETLQYMNYHMIFNNSKFSVNRLDLTLGDDTLPRFSCSLGQSEASRTHLMLD